MIPGQPTTKSGKPYKELYYEQVYVRVDKMENVTEVQKTIQEMGYGANSNAEWMEQTQEQMKMIQLVLGGIGAVSLFVAAIGIANTMMMSIYERTKEIGIIKVLGCDLGNIRTMFLLEAGFIGFFGGLIGLILSGIISIVINMIAGSAAGGYYEGISYIPIWLVVISLAFAVLGAIQYTDDMLANMQTMLQDVVEKSNSHYSAMMDNFQQFYNTITSNRAELAPETEEPAPQETSEAEEEADQ